MQNIHVERYSSKDNGHYQGVIEPEDRSWKLYILSDGSPHFLLRTQVEMEDGKVIHGYLNVEEMFGDDVTLRDLAGSTFGFGPEGAPEPHAP